MKRARPPAPAPVTLGEVRAVVVFADEPRALADWYLRAVDAKEVFSSPGFIGLSLGRATLFVQKTGEGHRPGMGGVRPHFTVPDCAEAFERLVTAGATPILHPADAGEELVAAVQDPAGNPLGLLAFKR